MINIATLNQILHRVIIAYKEFIMNTLYTNGKITKPAYQWLDDMGGIEVLIGRPLFGAPTSDLINQIMAENGLKKA